MKSPGHRAHPDHKVLEKRLDDRFTVDVGGEVVADSRNVIEVDEDGNPPRYYFLRSDVRMEKLARSDTTSHCPFKGLAHYYEIRAAGRTFADAVWTYQEPYEEHSGLKDRVAFWIEKFPEIAIHQRPPVPTSK
jgi:uncharacterized protein (DUF427 family)